MAKGNYTALQQLKPTELKVGEYYNSFVDDLIKRGDADRAARAKKLADQKKAIGERFGEFKTDPFSTIGQLQDFSNESLVNTANYIGQQRILAEQDPANAYKYIQKAERAYNDHRTLAASFGSKDFIDKSTGKMEALANNDVFAATDNNAKLAFLTNAKPLVRRNEETGNMELYMPKNENATPEDPLEKYSVGQTVGLFTSPDEINLLRSNKSNGNNGFLDKQVFDIAKQMADEYSRNYDGNRTNAKTWFSQDRGNLWFDSNFGAFNANKINPIIRQYSKDVNGKEIETEEDFLAAKKGIIDSIAALVEPKEKVDTKDTALETAIKQQQLVNERLEAEAKRVAIRNAKSGGGSGGGGNNSALGDGTLSVGNVVLNVKTKGKGGKTVTNHFQTQGLSYYVTGNTNDGKNSRIGVTTYWNPNGGSEGKGGFSFAMNIPSKDGKEVVIEGVNAERAKQILASNKVKDPQNILATMASMAEANKLKGVNPKGIGRGFSNYSVNFGTEATTKTPAVPTSGFGFPDTDYTKK